MFVERAPHNWPHSKETHETHYGDGNPWPSAVLDDQAIWRELRVLGRPHSLVFDANRGWRADSINFQPSPTTRTQDRYVVTQLDIFGHMWTLTGVFDGHLGDITAEHVAYHLPIIVRDFLREALGNDPTRTFSPSEIAQFFSRSIIAFDNAIAGDVLNLFGGIEGLRNYSDAQIRSIINDQHRGGDIWNKVRLCMYGTTALVALVDPDHKNLWVANLGDCEAVMVYPGKDPDSDWVYDMLTTSHNGDNDAEVTRVQNAHPGEPECMMDRRVLGTLAPTRCIGDVPYKQPPEFTRRILYNLLPGFHDKSRWEEFLLRNRTPPYVTAEPEVTHRQLDRDAPGTPRFLILVSDGFPSLCEDEGQKTVVRSWAREMVQVLRGVSLEKEKGPESIKYPGSENMALRLLRRALGGDDRYLVSQVLTLDTEEAWIDDTSIVVQTL